MDLSGFNQAKEGRGGVLTVKTEKEVKRENEQVYCTLLQEILLLGKCGNGTGNKMKREEREDSLLRDWLYYKSVKTLHVLFRTLTREQRSFLIFLKEFLLFSN